MRGLTLKQLEALKAILRHTSMAGAAAALGITPPAMTTRLKELEAIAGFPLFDRTREGMALNRAGAIIAEMAGEIHIAIEKAEGSLAQMRGITAGSLVIGITSTAKYFAPRLIADFARRHPGVDISLTVGNRGEIIAALQALRVDIAIMGRPPSGLPLEAEAFGDHPLVIIAPPDHALAKESGIARAKVAQEPFLLREEGSGTRGVFEEFFGGKVNRRTHFGIEIGSNETIKQGVMAGLGLALISAHTVAFELETGRLVALDVEGLPVMRTWFIARHPDKAMLPAIAAFRRFTLEEGRGHLPLQAF